MAPLEHFTDVVGTHVHSGSNVAHQLTKLFNLETLILTFNSTNQSPNWPLPEDSEVVERESLRPSQADDKVIHVRL